MALKTQTLERKAEELSNYNFKTNNPNLKSNMAWRIVMEKIIFHSQSSVVDMRNNNL